MTTKTENRHESNKTNHVSAWVHPVLGRLSSDRNSGEIRVACMDQNPVPARLLAGMNRNELLKEENQGRDVLVIFVNGNPDEPVIIGMLENSLLDFVSMEEKPDEARMDGECIIVKAEKELVLTCGKGSVAIKNDGRISINGTDIVSMASRVNAVKGSKVEFN